MVVGFIGREEYNDHVANVEVYVETSVWNCWFDDHVADLQRQTQELFERLAKPSDAQVYLSDVVLQELGNAPLERQALLGELIGRVNPIRLDLDSASASLAEAYIDHGILASGHLADARHVAIAVTAGLDVLVSWNYRHLVNRRRREAFNGVNAILGHRPIDIVSPPEVFDE